MSGPADRQDREQLNLRPHQRALVESLLSPDTPALALVHVAVGAGRGGAMVELFRRLLAQAPQARCLYIAPRLIAEQFEFQLREAGLPAEYVDRYRLRELIEVAGLDTPWPPGLAVLMTPQFARQQDVFQLLTTARWSVVVIAELEQVGWALGSDLERLAAAADRIVGLTGVAPGLGPAGPGSEVRLTPLRIDSSVDGAPVNVDLHEVNYHVTDGERRLCAALDGMVGLLKGGSKKARAAAGVLMRSFLSSPAALDGALRAFSSGLLQWTEDDLVGAGAESSSTASEQARATFRLDPEDLKGEAEGLLRMSDELKVDSKLEALRTHLKKTPAATTRSPSVVIASAFRSSIFYLASGLGDLGADHFVIHGSSSLEERSRSLSSFEANGGLLLASLEMLQGLEISRPAELVFFELPGKEGYFRVATSRWRRLGSEGLMGVLALNPRGLPAGATRSFSQGQARQLRKWARS